MIAPNQRRAFDELLEGIIAALPEYLRALLEEVPVIVEDDPSPEVLAEMDVDPGSTDLCGLHWGVPPTRKSVEHSGVLPENIWLFRGPIMRVARGQGGGTDRGGREQLRNQIRITLLHEIGHHFGLDEDDLAKLGYG
jgi:predicted Zn-dependent protease with MMP-like domain